MISGNRVAVVRQEPVYSVVGIRASVAQAMDGLRLSWRDVVFPGAKVVLKPNFIRQSHTHRAGEWEAIITHGSLVEAVAREVAEAMGGEGTITVADGPQTDSDCESICARVGIDTLIRALTKDYPRLTCQFVDLRREVWEVRDGVVVQRRRLADAPGGYTEIDLGRASSLEGKTGPFYGADYDTRFTQGHHLPGRHRYLLARLALDADLFVNLPKLKTHKKVGITISLKNLVGINGDKNYLPHFSMGPPNQGGDESPYVGIGAAIRSRSIHAFKQAMIRFPSAGRHLGPLVRRAGAHMFGRTEAVIRSGNWHGNDTAWRMVLDLNAALFHYDGCGRRRERPAQYLSIVDGIIAGEGDGPMEADAKPCGLLLAGTNPVAVDLVGATLMGFDWRRIPMIREAFSLKGLPLVDFLPEDVKAVPELGKPFQFRPHFGWVGHIEAHP